MYDAYRNDSDEIVVWFVVVCEGQRDPRERFETGDGGGGAWAW